MSYNIEKLNINNAKDYARVNALAWYQSYQGIVNGDFLIQINKEEEIQQATKRLIEGLRDDSRRFLLKVDHDYVGILRVRKSKYDKYPHCGELGALYLLDNAKKKGYGKILFHKAIEELIDMGYHDMVIGCLIDNPTNTFYQHMGGQLVDTNVLHIAEQTLTENVYYYENILSLKNKVDHI